MEGMSFPASMTPVVSRPIGLGKVFYVQMGASNNNNGVDPLTPFGTITYALSQCVSGRNDYIIVLDAWSEACPIIVNKTRVHIIGVCVPGSPFVVLTSDSDNPIFQVVGNTASYSEIAGFDLGGGDAHGAIEGDAGEGTTTDQLNIHHCHFGSEYCGDTPLNGILLTGPMGNRSWTIANCKFMGVNADSGGTLTASGITITGGGAHHMIRNNIFELCVAPALTWAGYSHTVIDNRFSCAAAAQGAAITTVAPASGSLIDGNSAMFQGETAMAQNPYLENNADANNWGDNKATVIAGLALSLLPA